jgi:protein-S-isoprenylcysteine O-methyltransferase Ste14
MIHVIPIPALWLVWFTYWNLAAIGNKPVRRRQDRASRALDILPLALAILLIAIWPQLPRPEQTDFLFLTFMPRNDAGYWIGVATVALGLGFSVWARRFLGRNWSGTVTLKENHELIRTGPYRLVRHPIYTGLLLGFIGSAIALCQWRGVIAVLLVLFVFLRRIRVEERWMIEIFGERYRAYRIETKALIPFIL